MIRAYFPWITFNAISVMFVLGSLVLIECIFYFRKSRWYFRLGPTLHREQWQTRATVAEAREAIARSLPSCGLPFRDHGDFAAIRRPWWVLSAYPRAVLRAEPGAEHAVLIYEVKPFLTMAPNAAYMLIMALGGIYPNIGFAMFAFVIIVYFGLWRQELRYLNRLPQLRIALRPIGVRVCEGCGYDLFAHETTARCPECGTASP